MPPSPSAADACPCAPSLIPDAERDAAWARIERQWPGYRAYERDSGRTVRLFRLQPVRDATARLNATGDTDRGSASSRQSGGMMGA